MTSSTGTITADAATMLGHATSEAYHRVAGITPTGWAIRAGDTSGTSLIVQDRDGRHVAAIQTILYSTSAGIITAGWLVYAGASADPAAALTAAVLIATIRAIIREHTRPDHPDG